jgi:hypothetical protein
MTASGTPARPRLGRTLTRSRWREYGALLDAALAHGYAVRSLEDWLAAPRREVPTVILRHDVDQDPRAVLPMAAVERDRGVRSTWYFRWRTAHAAIIAGLRRDGFHIGLHYETLTRRVLAGAGTDPGTIEACRVQLAEEVAAFSERFGAIRSICPHGDSRVPGVENAVLVRGVDVARFGVRWDGKESLREHGGRMGHWLTDRPGAEGWKDGLDPLGLLDAGTTPILCVTHPNNWSSGASLWADRLLGRALPARRYRWQWHPRLAHSGGDEPPVDRG